MGEHYTSDGLLKLVTKLQTFIGSTQALVATGSLDIGDVKTTIADLTPAAQSLDDLRTTCIPWPIVCAGRLGLSWWWATWVRPQGLQPELAPDALRARLPF